jgi:hypothetical protein
MYRNCGEDVGCHYMRQGVWGPLKTLSFKLTLFISAEILLKYINRNIVEFEKICSWVKTFLRNLRFEILTALVARSGSWMVMPLEAPGFCRFRYTCKITSFM